MISRNDWPRREIREALTKSRAIHTTATAAARAERVGYAEAVVWLRAVQSYGERG